MNRADQRAKKNLTCNRSRVLAQEDCRAEAKQNRRETVDENERETDLGMKNILFLLRTTIVREIEVNFLREFL